MNSLFLILICSSFADSIDVRQDSIRQIQIQKDKIEIDSIKNEDETNITSKILVSFGLVAFLYNCR
jgi:hypothetical protein